MRQSGKIVILARKKGTLSVGTARVFIVTPYMHCQRAPKGSFGTRHVMACNIYTQIHKPTYLRNTCICVFMFIYIHTLMYIHIYASRSTFRHGVLRNSTKRLLVNFIVTSLIPDFSNSDLKSQESGRSQKHSPKVAFLGFLGFQLLYPTKLEV